MVWDRFNRSTEVEIDMDLTNPTISLILRILDNHLGKLAEPIFVDSCNASGISSSKITKKNIGDFSQQVQSLTADLLGELGAKYLRLNLEKAIA